MLVGKGIRGAGDEALMALRRWWKVGGKAGKEGAEAAAKQTGKVMDDLADFQKLTGATSKRFVGIIDEAESAIGKSIQELNRRITNDNSQLERITRYLAQYKNRLNRLDALENADEIDNLRSTISEYTQLKQFYTKRIAENTNKLERVTEIANGVYDPTKHKSTLNMIQQNTDLHDLPGISNVRKNLRNATSLYDETLAYTSKNLGNDKAFLKEYLALKRNPHRKLELEMWADNPHNAKKISELYSSQKIADIIGRGKLTTRESLLGLTTAERAKNLGVGTAALAGAGAAVTAYSWFGENDPEDLAQTSSNMAADLSSFKTYGYGSKIAGKAQAALNNLQTLGKNVSSGLAKDPENAATNYVTGVEKELKVLASALNQWDAVVAGSDKPEEAKKAKQAIEALILSLTNQLKSLGKGMGLQMNTGGGGLPQGMPSSGEIVKIQSFLNLPQTGKLDYKTANSLRKLEQDFNRKSKDAQWTGAFVVPEVGYVISYDNLQKAFEIIKKY